MHVTFGHPLFVVGKGWLEAGRLGRDDIVFSLAKGRLHVTKISDDPNPELAYNFEVSQNHNYQVGELGAEAHNAYSKPPLPGRPTFENTAGRFKPGKGGGHYRYHPKPGCKGYRDKDRNIWEPTNHNGTHDPHWDIQFPDGTHEPFYPI